MRLAECRREPQFLNVNEDLPLMHQPRDSRIVILSWLIDGRQLQGPAAVS
jgi:hypothetical protein